MYNQKLIRTLEDRFDKLQTDFSDDFDGVLDLYAFIASIIYDKKYTDCFEPNPQGKELRERAKQFILPLVVECGDIWKIDRINQKLLRTLEDRFDKLQAYLFRSFDGEEDLYSFIASILYDKDYEDCCEWKNGEPNPQGKELRDRAKQFILPIVVECGGISEGEED